MGRATFAERLIRPFFIARLKTGRATFAEKVTCPFFFGGKMVRIDECKVTRALPPTVCLSAYRGGGLETTACGAVAL